VDSRGATTRVSARSDQLVTAVRFDGCDAATSAFHQFADMGADRIRKSLKVLTAFEDRHETALAVLSRGFHQFLLQPGEIVGRHAFSEPSASRTWASNPADDEELRLNVIL
jgi:hypothetical protein